MGIIYQCSMTWAQELGHSSSISTVAQYSMTAEAWHGPNQQLWHDMNMTVIVQIKSHGNLGTSGQLQEMSSAKHWHSISSLPLPSPWYYLDKYSSYQCEDNQVSAWCQLNRVMMWKPTTTSTGTIQYWILLMTRNLLISTVELKRLLKHERVWTQLSLGAKESKGQQTLPHQQRCGWTMAQSGNIISSNPYFPKSNMKQSTFLFWGTLGWQFQQFSSHTVLTYPLHHNEVCWKDLNRYNQSMLRKSSCLHNPGMDMKT